MASRRHTTKGERGDHRRRRRIGGKLETGSLRRGGSNARTRFNTYSLRLASPFFRNQHFSNSFSRASLGGPSIRSRAFFDELTQALPTLSPSRACPSMSPHPGSAPFKIIADLRISST